VLVVIVLVGRERIGGWNAAMRARLVRLGGRLTAPGRARRAAPGR
jgi:hypothetical protein